MVRASLTHGMAAPGQLAVLAGAFSLRAAVARPQQVAGVAAPSAPSAPGPAPAPFSAAVAGNVPPAAVTFVPILQQHFEQAPDGQYRWR